MTAMTVVDDGLCSYRRRHDRGGRRRARRPKSPVPKCIDADGDVVMPGMVNPHCHMAMTLFRGLGEDVDDRLYRYVLPMERKFVTPRDGACRHASSPRSN